MGALGGLEEARGNVAYDGVGIPQSVIRQRKEFGFLRTLFLIHAHGQITKIEIRSVNNFSNFFFFFRASCVVYFFKIYFSVFVAL